MSQGRDRFGRKVNSASAIACLRALAAEDPDFRRDPELRRELRAHLRRHGRALIRQRQRGRCTSRRPGTRRVRRTVSSSSSSSGDDGPGGSEPPERGRP